MCLRNQSDVALRHTMANIHEGDLLFSILLQTSFAFGLPAAFLASTYLTSLRGWSVGHSKREDGPVLLLKCFDLSLQVCDLGGLLIR